MKKAVRKSISRKVRPPATKLKNNFEMCTGLLQEILDQHNKWACNEYEHACIKYLKEANELTRQEIYYKFVHPVYKHIQIGFTLRVAKIKKDILKTDGQSWADRFQSMVDNLGPDYVKDMCIKAEGIARDRLEPKQRAKM